MSRWASTGVLAVRQRPVDSFDSCSATLDELGNYSRVTDEAGEPLEAIADKSQYHRLDALRYVGSYPTTIGNRKATGCRAMTRSTT